MVEVAAQRSLAESAKRKMEAVMSVGPPAHGTAGYTAG